MHLRAFLVVLLGLAIFAPAGPSAFAAPRDPALPLILAQANQAEEKAEAEDDQRRKSRRPDRDSAKDKGAARDAVQRGERESKAKAAAEEKEKRDAAQKAERDAKAKAAAEEKEKRAAAQKAERDARAKAAAEEKEKRDAAQKAERDAKAKAAEDEKSKQAPASEPRLQTRERDRERPSRDRARRSDDDRRAGELLKQREAEKTSARELSKTEVRGDKPAAIDGGSRTLRREGNRVVIRSNDVDRLRAGRNDRRGDQRVERLPNGQTRTIVIYPDGTQIITITNARGDIVHRSRRDRNGREIVLIREINRAPLAQINLGPLRITIPREQYIVDARRASRRDMYAAMIAPPVEPIERLYSLEEVRRFDRIRDKMRRIDINTITFDTDSAIITADQAYALEELADIINELIDRNPEELFLIEGHTDLVGSEIYNLALSDRRAEAVAIALTDYFDVPPENLVTQGYGEAYPKIPTELAERENRRVAVRRITPLVASAR